MFSRQYLDQVERDIQTTRRAYRASQLLVLCLAMLLVGCAAFRQVVKDRMPEPQPEPVRVVV